MSVLVGKKAPDFTATAVKDKSIIDSFKLYDVKKRFKVLFFYPLDFTFVCPTELHAFNEKIADFAARDAELVGVSVDSQFSHYAWLETPKAKGGIEGVKFTLVSDLTKSISRDYDVLVEDGSVAYRGLFLIDKDNIVRHQVVNDLPLGRNVDEVLRMIDALAYYEDHGEVCPANWRKGDKAMTPDAAGLKSYYSSAK